MILYRYNRRSGIWDPQRTVTVDTANEWISKFERDEPGESFKVSKVTPKGLPKMKKLTFAAARAALQSALRAAGWQLSPPYNPQGKPYKVPYATSPDGVVRLWFKTEAVYAAVNTSDIGQAHSACSDMRELDPERFAANIHEDVVRWHMRMRERGL